jgi:predicted FMN-binding regulatory protein PaiB
MDGATPALVAFHGPHGYVSPTWYETAPAVPTWNYGVVHAHGRPRANEDDAFVRGVCDESRPGPPQAGQGCPTRSVRAR